MKLSEVKSVLAKTTNISFQLPNGDLVPSHFHITEVGSITKNFIDCGGTIRKEKKIQFQLWTAEDYEHRLSSEKLQDIITIFEDTFQPEDAEIEVEYQGETIQKFNLEVKENTFLLVATKTDCLAKDKCGIPEQKPKVNLSELQNNSCCDPNSGCC